MKTCFKTGCALFAATALTALGTAPATAQIKTSPPASTLMIAPPTPDADALAAEMRVLAANPKDVEALTKAGELTLKLGDPTAAANLFARADKIEPNNGQIKADEGAVLVHMERPGEALRLFQQAVAMGADPAGFVAERGLAYDLIGQQERAQRDYRLALARHPDDAETMRRYALSLGISGKRKEALAEIDPLVRRQDHAGWRDRAFILAMTGDVDQAKKITAAMLPAQMAEGLAPFFDRLPGLSASDKAFAVHFGDLQVTPQRLADARMTPPLPPLAPDAVGSQLAATAAPPPPQDKRKRRERKKHGKEEAAPLQGATAVAANTASSPIPVHVETVPRAAQTEPVRTAIVPRATPTEPVRTASAPRSAPVESVRTASAPRPAAAEPARTVSTPSAPVPTAPAASATISQRQAAGAPAPVPAPPPRAPESRVAATASGTAPVPTDRPGARVGEEDHILANIMAGITVPSSELASRQAAARAAAVPAPALARPAAPLAAKTRQLEAANVAAIKQAAADKAAAEAAAAAKRKADEAKKAAAAKKTAGEKAAAEKRAKEKAKEKEEKANPSRIWVQVAGGAYEGDLPKAWAKVKAKAPEAFKGKTGWTTPLRATNRVLAGPFKSDEAAQDFVNQLAKKGIHAFAFTSDKGQKVDKLPTK